MRHWPRAPLGLLAIVILLGLTWLLQRAHWSAPAAMERAPGNAVKPAAGGTELTQHAEALGRAAVSGSSAAEEALPARSDTPPAALRRLTGTLRFFDPFGAHRPVSQGSFRLHSGTEVEPRTVSVEHGAWSADVSDDTLELSAFTVEGVPAFLHSSTSGFYRFPADGVLHLLVRRDRGCRLVVVDAANGRELGDVEVVRDSNQTRWGKRSPEGSVEETRVAEHAPSPIELEPKRDTELYFVRGAGYAWRSVVVRRSACGDRLVALRPGGDLAVVLGGVPAPEGAELRLRRTQEQTDPYASQYVDHRRAIGPLDRRFDFDSIEAGEYEVSVEVGVNTWKPARVAATSCSVKPGERARVEFVLPSPEPATLVAAAGTLRASGWPEAGYLTLYSRFAPRVGGQHVYRANVAEPSGPPEALEFAWSVPTIEPGQYSGFLSGPSFYFDLTIEPENKHDYVIHVPRPADVRLRVLDARTGAPADVSMVSWLGYAGEWRPGGQVSTASFDPNAGHWRFTAPATKVSLWINDDDYEFRNTPRELVPGVNELKLRLPRASGIIVTFVHGEEPVARGPDWEVELVHLHGSRAGFANSLDDDDVELILKAPEPGSYRLSAKGLDGYRIVSSLDVTVPIDGFAHVAVELERMR